MPLEIDKCDGCGRNRDICPECGSSFVSIDNREVEGTFGPNFSNFGKYGEVGENVAYAIVCWDCGHEEERRLVMEEL